MSHLVVELKQSVMISLLLLLLYSLCSLCVSEGCIVVVVLGTDL